jgi:hypothetical protein
VTRGKRRGHVSSAYADGLETPTAALGVCPPTPTATIRRRSPSHAVLETAYADGTDFWPSA